MVEINNTTKQKINQVKTKKIVEEFLREYKQKNKEVSLALVSAARMRRLNSDYRGIDKTTDVLSFAGEDKYLGEVVINVEEVNKANKYLEVFGLKKSAEYIFYFLLVHGLLHLVGFSDTKEIDRQKMIRQGEEFLERCL
jgi:probable rRNA maturation factor